MEIQSRIEKLKARRQVLQEDLDEKRSQLQEQKQEREDAEEARAILQVAAKLTQRNLEARFSNLVTTAFNIIFDDPYEFKPEFVERRNKTECDLWFVKNKRKLRPRFAAGGGVLDVASLALRLAYQRLEGSSPVMILDEPFRNLSRDKLPSAAETLCYLSNELGIQMVIVTHLKEIAQRADMLFEVNQGNVEIIPGRKHGGKESSSGGPKSRNVQRKRKHARKVSGRNRS